MTQVSVVSYCKWPSNRAETLALIPTWKWTSPRTENIEVRTWIVKLIRANDSEEFYEQRSLISSFFAHTNAKVEGKIILSIAISCVPLLPNAHSWNWVYSWMCCADVRRVEVPEKFPAPYWANKVNSRLACKFLAFLILLSCNVAKYLGRVMSNVSVVWMNEP